MFSRRFKERQIEARAECKSDEFEGLSSAVLGASSTDLSSVKILVIELRFFCATSACQKKMIAEIAVRTLDGERPRRWRNSATHCAWQALEAYYEGEDVLFPNIFVDGELTEAEEYELNKDLALIRLEEAKKAPHSEFLGWLESARQQGNLGQAAQISA